MAIERNFTGFEFADSGELRYGSGTFSGTLNSFPSDGTARSGSRYLRADASTSSANYLAFPVGSIVGTTGTVTAGNHKRVSVRGYFRLEAAFNNGQIRIAGFGGDTGTCTVWFGNENTAGGFTQAGSLIGLRIGAQTFQHNPGVSVPFSGQSITANVWYRMLLDLDILVDGTNSVLSATLRITEDSDSPSVDFTLTNTANIGANVDAIDQFALGYSSNSIGSFGKRATMHWDDVVYIAVSNTDAVAGQPTLPTQTHIYAIVPPTGAASNTGWSGTYADVDEYPGSGADSMSSSTAGAEVEFTHATAIALGYGSIAAMKLYVNALISGAGTGSVDYMLNGTAKNVTLVTNYPFNSPSDPVGGVSFGTLTAKAFSATTFGIRKANGTQATVLANIGLEVIGDLAAYGNGSQIRGETQIKAGSIYDAQIADTAAIARHKIAGLNDGPAPVFFPEEVFDDGMMIPGPRGASGASSSSVQQVVPVFFPEDEGGGDMGPPGPAGATGAAGSALTIAGSVWRSTNQTLTHNVEAAISFDTEHFDVGTVWVVGSPTRLTVPASQDGTYLVTGTVQLGVGFQGVVHLRVYKNGTLVAANSSTGSNVASGSESHDISVLLALVATDYVELKVLLVLAAGSGTFDVVGGTSATFFQMARQAPQPAVSGGASAGTITGTAAVNITSPVNLTTDGTYDFLAIGAHNGGEPRAGTLPGQKLAGGGGLTASFCWLGGGQTVSIFSQASTASFSATGSDYAGGGALTASTTAAGINSSGGGAVNFGFTLNAVASKTTSRRLRIYVGQFSCILTITAKLSDGTATPVSLTFDSGAGAGAEKMFQFDYQAGTDGAYLIVTAICTTNRGSVPFVKPLAATIS